MSHDREMQLHAGEMRLHQWDPVQTPLPILKDLLAMQTTHTAGQSERIRRYTRAVLQRLGFNAAEYGTDAAYKRYIDEMLRKVDISSIDKTCLQKVELEEATGNQLDEERSIAGEAHSSEQQDDEMIDAPWSKTETDHQTSPMCPNSPVNDERASSGTRKDFVQGSDPPPELGDDNLSKIPIARGEHDHGGRRVLSGDVCKVGFSSPCLIDYLLNVISGVESKFYGRRTVSNTERCKPDGE